MSSKSGTESTDSELRIQTFIRVKPLDTNEEKSARLEFGRNEVTIKTDNGRNPKTLAFDKVFNETASQKRVYETVVQPLVKEVLQGYNCTIFAYGQTSTGKTYTMSGDFESLGENNIHAGMIPRAMTDIFSELEKLKCEYQVKISYLELYNEKMRSLLKFYDDEFNIQVLEGTDGKIILKGLVLTPVQTKEQALNLLKGGMQKKQIASTKMNINSSRSHTIFTITVCMKEVVEGNNDDVITIGKLHLVDLAGSENVSKSGTGEIMGAKKRINEMSNINRSLLSLGRVITSLTENNPHIPYRESKLTRFLKDSLGGNTKTCMVGTISLSDTCLDETENTLNFTNKARLIKNKPEKNEKVSKKNLMEMLAEETMKLKRDLEAARLHKGLYISKESYTEMTDRLKELTEQRKVASGRYKILLEEYNKNMTMFNSLSADFDEKRDDFEDLTANIEHQREKFKEKLDDHSKEITIREHLLEQYKEAESKLTERAKKSKSVLENVHEQNLILHNKIDRLRNVQHENINALGCFKEQFATKMQTQQEKFKSFSEDASTNYIRQGEGAKNVMSVIKDDQLLFDQLHKMQQIVAKRNEDVGDNSAVLMDENQEQLSHIVPYLEKWVKNVEQLCMHNMREVVQPNIDTIRNQLATVNVATEETLEFIKKYNQKKDLLRGEAEINLENFNEAKTCIETEIDLLLNNAKTALKKAHETCVKAKFAAKKVKALKVAAADVEKYSSKTQEASAEVGKTMRHISESIDNIEYSVKKDLEPFKEAQDKTFKEMKKEDELINEIKTDFVNQAFEKVTELLREAVPIQEKVAITAKECYKLIDSPYGVVEGRFRFAAAAAENYLEYLRSLCQNVDVGATNVVNELNSKTDKYKDICQKTLKMDENDNPSSEGEIEALRQDTASALSDIKSDVEHLSYIRDVPTGKTPQRGVKCPQLLEIEELTISQSSDEPTAISGSSVSTDSSSSNDGSVIAYQKPSSLRRSLSLPEIRVATSSPIDSSYVGRKITPQKYFKNPAPRRNVKAKPKAPKKE